MLKFRLMPSPPALAVMTVCACIALNPACLAASPARAAPRPIKLRYDPALQAMGFRSPLLRGTIHGRSVWFLIDTGASVHTLAAWLVNEAQIVTHTTNSTTKGSTGVESPVRAVSEEEIHVKGRRSNLRLKEAIVVGFPAIFEQQRIGGLLSPQLLAPSGLAAILDLHAPRLSFGARPEPSPGTRVCRNPDSPFVNRVYAAPVAIAGLQGLMLIDTGATGSVAAPSSAMARSLSGRASETGHTQGVGGTATTTPKVPNVALQFAGSGAEVSLTIGGAPTACGGDGLLGMDALRECHLVLGESAFAWSCRPRK
jgi:hypothetical protein